jgi:hypothetical protein
MLFQKLKAHEASLAATLVLEDSGERLWGIWWHTLPSVFTQKPGNRSVGACRQAAR